MNKKGKLKDVPGTAREMYEKAMRMNRQAELISYIAIMELIETIAKKNNISQGDLIRIFNDFEKGFSKIESGEIDCPDILFRDLGSGKHSRWR
jgi:anaerobic selenocysteine-containing dehydrogenase